MEAKELMIGDWVYCTYLETEPIPTRICAINFYSWRGKDHCDWVDVGIDDDFDWDEVPLSDIHPIPLTPEILEKNGFVETTEEFMKPNRFFRTKDGRVMVSDLTNSGDGYWNVHIDNEDYQTVGSCDVKYVHQFQQMLRLCGYEIDVVV